MHFIIISIEIHVQFDEFNVDLDYIIIYWKKKIYILIFIYIVLSLIK